jgi:hypothetical protein
MFDHYSNMYARWIRVIALLTIVLGIIGGLVLWLISDFAFTVLISTWGYSIVTGIFLYGFAEIIEILYRIHQRLEAVDGIRRLLEKMSKPE